MIKIIHQHRAYYKHRKGSKKVIIFIHGILESPNQFRHLAQLAYGKGYSIYGLSLPGHGQGGTAFAKTSLKEWVFFIEKEISKFKGKEVTLVGHSMGALLSVYYTLWHPGRIKSLVLIAMPLKLKIKERVVRGAVAIARGSYMDAYTWSEYKAIGIMGGKPMIYLQWLPRYFDLFILIAYINKHIIEVEKSMLLVFSKKDEFVTLEGIEKPFQHLQGEKIKMVILEESGHFSYHHSDIQKLEKAFVSFIE